MNLSLIRVLSLWLSSSFWLNYPHTEIKVAVFLLLISICSNYNMWVRVVQKYKRTKSDSEFKAQVDWTGWGQWLWWSPDYLVKYLMKWWPESHEVWWGYSWNAHNNFPKKSSPARWNSRFQDNVSYWLWWNIFHFSATMKLTLRFWGKCLHNIFIKSK